VRLLRHAIPNSDGGNSENALLFHAEVSWQDAPMRAKAIQPTEAKTIEGNRMKAKLKSTHAPDDACLCGECVSHRAWLALHLRALAEHAAAQKAAPMVPTHRNRLSKPIDPLLE
jgi:hypothetical protein